MHSGWVALTRRGEGRHRAGRAGTAQDGASSWAKSAARSKNGANPNDPETDCLTASGAEDRKNPKRAR